MKNIALRVYPKKSKVILTGNALYVDEGFKLWTADQVEQGVKLVGIQHGGNYGTSRLSSFEKHEIDISDRYFSWGWRSKNENKVVALSGSKLIGIEKMISPDPRGYILWTCVFVPRYFYRMYSNPMGPQALEYVEDQRNFLNSTSKEVAKLIIMRAKPVEFGWQIKDRIKEWAHNVPLDWGDGSFYKKINGSRLVVVTGNATVLLEVLVANFPAILFWNPKYWEVRPEAEPYFNLLRQAGILYDTPEAAAKKINDIYINPMEWWLQPDVQKARALFCQQYAYLNEESWLQEWKAALIEISKLDK
jgi:putative transferase (TIGR04331 family)